MSITASLSLEGRIAIVTGASRGIGRAIAIELAKRGASVVVNYLRSAQSAEEVVSIIQQNGGQAIKFQADVSDFLQAQALIKTALDEFGNLDILVNNAGITRDNLIMMMSDNDWEEVISTNLKSTFNCSKFAVRHMMRKRFGRIINITSVSGQMGNAGQTNYSASKAGQIGFTKALAREVASRNITVNAIAAGYVETEIWANVSEGIRQTIINLIPLGRKGEPEEIAYAVAFLASDQAAYITGQILGIDGGMAMM
jgi:3-oxoacyl-[acyl-carrier protein] reductase